MNEWMNKWDSLIIFNFSHTLFKDTVTNARAYQNKDDTGFDDGGPGMLWVVHSALKSWILSSVDEYMYMCVYISRYFFKSIFQDPYGKQFWNTDQLFLIL